MSDTRPPFRVTIPPASLAAIDLAIAEGRHTPLDLTRDFRPCHRCKRLTGPNSIDLYPEAGGAWLCQYCAVASGLARWK